ncbi:hypothetical protein M0811_06609 [Anaeramoeba ignava]|uniref:BTB domain-containing protein n=1 Tax=Anaeramoeba ignava TaxID=1746090 RepID=A0A9Q0RD37_ANAIG|nr:hypothetical protein M0811_06609 [Anaeramoeba ignava]
MSIFKKNSKKKINKEFIKLHLPSILFLLVFYSKEIEIVSSTLSFLMEILFPKKKGKFKKTKGEENVQIHFYQLDELQSPERNFIIERKEKQYKFPKLILIMRSELYRGMFLSVTNDTSNKVTDYSELSNKSFQIFEYWIYSNQK